MTKIRSRSNSFNNNHSCSKDASASVKVFAKRIAKEKYDDALLWNKRDKYGRTELHRLASACCPSLSFAGTDNVNSMQSKCLAKAQQLLNRALHSSNRNILSQMLFCQDLESGYTALHRAIYAKNLTMILLLLRFALLADGTASTNSENDDIVLRFSSYMVLLESTTTKANPTPSILQEMMAVKDKEGFTPIQLLGILYAKDLTKNSCQNKTQNNFSYGTEVLTFGSTDHPALGQFRSNAKTTTSAPFDNNNNRVVLGRVEEFAATCPIAKTEAQLEQKLPNSSNIMDCAAVAIAAATHHTLVLTGCGHLYAFGLGKGGRLGLGKDFPQVLKPTLVPFHNSKQIVSIAAAENHSLCTTSDGFCYGWGSNRFGQLGATSNKETTDTPSRVLDLRKEFITHVAAGDRHSVALTSEGKVFCFGDNKLGQLGLPTTAAGAADHSNSSSKLFGQVTSLSTKVVIAIAASDKSTLVLTKPKVSTSEKQLVLPNINSIYSCGNGSYFPMRVHFPSSKAEKRNDNFSLRISERSSNLVNPVAIACAKYHNVAISEDGKVYTWGLHLEPLARDLDTGVDSAKNMNSKALFRNNNSNINTVCLPQLVKGMLPENGGGKVVAASASEHHTAVLTSAGHLFTWGVTDNDNRVLGHDGVKYQPSPRRVNGVFHAHAVSVAREHTALLIGTTYPPLPYSNRNGTCCSLQQLCESKVAENTDIFNAVPLYLMAERMNCFALASFCFAFMQSNMDTILSVAKKHHLDLLLEESLKMGRLLCDDEEEKDSSSIYGTYAESLPQQQRHEAGEIRQAADGANNSCDDSIFIEERVHVVHPSLKTTLIVNERMDMSDPEQVLLRYESLSKAFRAIKKKLNLVIELTAIDVQNDTMISCKKLSEEQQEKLARKPLLEADLSLLKPALEEAHRRMEHFSLFDKLAVRKLSISREDMPFKNDDKLRTTIISEEAATESVPLITTNKNSGTDDQISSRFHCQVCNVSCPDENSLSLHKNGRKHRNWVNKLKNQEEKELAERMTREKRLEATTLEEPKLDQTYKNHAKNEKEGLGLPIYNLPPPSYPTSTKDPNGSDVTWSKALKEDWAKAIPRKVVSNSSVRKPPLTSNNVQVAKVDEKMVRAADSQVGFSKNGGNQMRRDGSVISSAQLKAPSLQQIMEDEEKICARKVQKQKLFVVKNESLTTGFKAGEKITEEIKQTVTSHSTTISEKKVYPVAPAWTNNRAPESTKTERIITTKVRSFLEIQHQEANSVLMAQQTIICSKKFSSSADAWGNNLSPKLPRTTEQSNTADFVKRQPHDGQTARDLLEILEIQHHEASSILLTQQADFRSLKKSSCSADEWGDNLASKLPTTSKQSGTADLLKQNPNDGQTARGLLEIQREQEDFKSKAPDAAKGTIWYVAQRERAASLGEIQQLQEEEEQFKGQFERLVKEQKFIEEQIAKEIALNNQGKQNRSNREVKVKKSRGEQRDQRQTSSGKKATKKPFLPNQKKKTKDDIS